MHSLLLQDHNTTNASYFLHYGRVHQFLNYSRHQKLFKTQCHLYSNFTRVLIKYYLFKLWTVVAGTLFFRNFFFHLLFLIFFRFLMFFFRIRLLLWLLFFLFLLLVSMMGSFYFSSKLVSFFDPVNVVQELRDESVFDFVFNVFICDSVFILHERLVFI